ncbi:MAG: hypothetical protein V3W41_01660 [Planctomycetota bacterium]
MANKPIDRVSATEQLRIEAHERLTKAQRGITEKPADREARAVYVEALQKMRDAADLKERAPEVGAEFDRARNGVIAKREPKKAKASLYLKPPGPSPMGTAQ